MGQLSAPNNARYKRLFSAFVFAVVIAVGIPRFVYAENTKVIGQFCTPFVSAAAMQIVSPAPAAVVEKIPVTFQGNVTQVSQINIELNDQYHATVPIASGQTTFTTDIDLPKGTSTLTFTGIDVCHVTDPKATIAITYAPIESTPDTSTNPDQPTAPDRGTSTSSIPSPSTPTSISRTPINANGEPIRTVEIPFQNVPLIGPVTKLAYDLAVRFDFDNRSMQVWQQSVIRFAAFAIGAFLIAGLPLVVFFMRSRVRLVQVWRR